MKMTDEQKLSVYGSYLNIFKTPEIKLIVEEIIKHTPTIFFGASTSSTGKYHPNATNGVMGLVKHSIAVMLTAEDLMKNETIMETFGLSQINDKDREMILAACLIHDNAKYGYEDNTSHNSKNYTQQNHPRLIVDIAKKAKLNKLTGSHKKTLIIIINLIKTHMGQWVTVRDGEDLPLPKSKSQAFVHTCDYIASRKTLDIVSQLSLPEDLDPKLVQWFEFQATN